MQNNIKTVNLGISYTGGWFSNIYAFQTNTQLPIIDIIKSSDVNTSTMNGIVTYTFPLNLVPIPVSITKLTNRTYANSTDIIQYTLLVKNVGTQVISPLVIDTLPDGIEFVNGSLTIDGLSSALNPTASPWVTLSNLAANQVSTLVFNVTISSGISSNSIQSNSVVTNILYVDLSSIRKYVDKVYANIGDTLTYTINVTNTGNLLAKNVVFIDTIPIGTTFINGSMELNGSTVSGDPNIGANIGDIAEGQSVTITFKVKIN